MSWVAFASASAFLALGGSALAGNLVQNGDFTAGGTGQIDVTTTAPGWSNASPPGDNFVMNDGTVGALSNAGVVSLWTANNGGDVPAGNNTWDGFSSLGSAHNFLVLDGDWVVSSVVQTLSGLTVGKTYTLSFDFAFAQQFGFTSVTEQNLTACVGSSCVTYPGANYILPSHGFSGWTGASQTFTATSTSEVLSFLAFGDSFPAGGNQAPPFALVSNVDIPGAPGPGPATGALAVFGLLALGYARTRARGQA